MSIKTAGSDLSLPLMYAAFFALVLSLARLLVRDSFVLWAVSGSLALRVWFSLATNWNAFSLDIHGHIKYIELLSRTGAVPSPSACWQCYQPPLYYHLMSGWRNLLYGTNLYWESCLRPLNFLLSSCFLLVGIRLVSRVAASRKAVRCGAILFLFWPDPIMLSGVINNDQLALCFGALAILLAYSWSESGSRRIPVFAGACIFAGLATLSKSNGVLIFPVLLSVLVFGHGGTNRFRRLLSSAELVVLASALGLALWAGHHTNIRRAQGAESLRDPLVGNIQRQRQDVSYALELPRDTRTFLPGPEQIGAFLFQRNPNYRASSPFTRSHWAVFLRSSLGGSWMDRDEDPAGHVLVFLLSVLLLALVALAGWGAVQHPQARQDAVVVLIFLAGSVGFRFLYSFACSSDFRYVLPSLAFLVRMVPHGMDGIRGRGAVGLTAGFAILSTALVVFYMR